MKQPHTRDACRALGILLLLAMTPALPAHEAGAAQRPAPYRLDSKLLLQGDTAPYRLTAATSPLADKPYARQIEAAARDAGLDPALVHAVISVESAYQPAAVSPKGAVGLMQVLPETALRYGVTDPARVTDNLRAGTRYLRDLMTLFDNRIELALAAYNAGEGAVKRYNNTIPPYPETRHYVPTVIGKYRASGGRAQSVRRTSTRLMLTQNYLAGTRLAPPPPRSLDHF